MNKNRRGISNIEIDDSNPEPVPTLFQRFKNALFSAVLGLILVQMFFFYWAVRSGTFAPLSVVIFYKNIYFWVFLGICAIMGWIFGQGFVAKLKDEIETWKSW